MNQHEVTPSRVYDLMQELIASIGTDLETGSHHFNNAAHEAFAKKYPTLVKAINDLADYIEPWGPE